MSRRRHLLAFAAVVTLALLVACSDGGDAAGSSPAPTTPADAATPTVPPLHPSVDGYPEAVVTLESPDGERLRVAAKVADTDARRTHGLMEVPELPAGTGMLFVFPGERRGGFWMKDTLVPLGIAFAAPDGEIRAVLQMEPCEADPCPVHDPEVSYRFALEVPRGWFADHGVEPGWSLQRAA